MQRFAQVMPDYSFLSREGSRLDARFKFVHARVKTCAESIAFFGGGEREHQIVNKRFDRLMAHDWLRLKANCKFQIVEDVFRNRIPDLLQVSACTSGTEHWMVLPSPHPEQWSSSIAGVDARALLSATDVLLLSVAWQLFAAPESVGAAFLIRLPERRH